MERINILEKEVADLRKILVEKENELYDLKKKWVSKPQLEAHLKENSDVFQNQAQPGRLPRWAIERYSRQILLPEIGVEGQVRLMEARVLIVGAGGLGCPAAAYLAGAGVGEIGLVDYDTVDLTNIHRQILHSEQDQRVSKVHSAADSLRRINSNIKITQHNVQLDSNNALAIIDKYHAVLDCSDNVPTRYLLNDACALTKLPLISGSALKMEGQLTVYGYRAPNNNNEKESFVGPCYRCLFPAPPPPGTVGSCSANGVAGPVPGLIGALQALEAIKLLVGMDHQKLLVERMLIFDGEDCTFRTVRLRGRTPGCAACGVPGGPRLLDYEAFCKARAREQKRQEAKAHSQKRKEERDKRMQGLSYYGFRKDGNLDKWVQDVPKSERRMGPSCNAEICKRGTLRKCGSFDEARRRQIFNYFWNDLDWSGKKNYVRSLVDNAPPKRRRTIHKDRVSRKGDSKKYHLFYNDERLPVCRVSFLNTLGIKEAMVRSWLLSTDKPREYRKPVKALSVDAFIDGLPKTSIKCPVCKTMPNYSGLMYLNIDHVKNQFQLYSAYVSDMKCRGVPPASRKTFAKVFLAKNLKIFKPKNDTDVCDIVNEHNVVSYSAEDSGNMDVGPNGLHITYIPQWE